MLKSIGAGYVIGVMAHFYKECDNHIAGAALFGIGLLVICQCKLNLFTGKIGTTRFDKCIPILLGNMLGVSFAILCLRLMPEIVADAVACGALMQMAVTLYKKHPWATVACVAAFLFGGFRHCIAMLYMAELTADYWLEFLAVVFYNGFGAWCAATLGVVDTTSES